MSCPLRWTNNATSDIEPTERGRGRDLIPKARDTCGMRRVGGATGYFPRSPKGERRQGAICLLALTYDLVYASVTDCFAIRCKARGVFSLPERQGPRLTREKEEAPSGKDDLDMIDTLVSQLRQRGLSMLLVMAVSLLAVFVSTLTTPFTRSAHADLYSGTLEVLCHPLNPVGGAVVPAACDAIQLVQVSIVFSPNGGTGSPITQDLWTQQPPNGDVLRIDQWGRVNGAWTCHKWEQLPEGSDITCGYVSLIMPPPFETSPYPSYPIWACTKDRNILPYPEPYSVKCDYFNQDLLDRLQAVGVQVLLHAPSEVDAWSKAFNSLFAVYGYDQTLATSRLNEVRSQAGLPAIKPVQPGTTFGEGVPSGTIGSENVTIIFEPSPGNTDTECKLDGAAFSACTSPQEYTGLSNGTHTFRVRAVDPFGNVDPTPAKTTWTVDTIRPTVKSTTPLNSATGVGRGTNLTATFSEKMRASTINASSFKLFKFNSDGT
jgi:Bacterial Ig-like domain